MDIMVNWEAMGALAESVGAIGVIATLAYLGLQVRQSNQNLRAEWNRQLGRDYADDQAVTMDDQHIGAFLKGLNSYWDLTSEERFKFDSCVTRIVNSVEVTILQTDAGRLEEELAMQRQYLGPRLFAYPGMRDWWKHGRGTGFGTATQNWVNEQIQRNKDTETFWDASPPASSAT